MQTLLNYILFYGILMPLSLLPMWFLYVLSSLIRLLLCYVIKYRKNIIASNLANSFPEKSKAEINHLINEYYAHLADLLVEAVKMLTISKKNLLRRYKCINHEWPNAFYEQGRSIVLASAHYNNWEYMVASLDMQISHHGVGVGKRMSNKTFELLSFSEKKCSGSLMKRLYQLRTTSILNFFSRKSFFGKPLLEYHTISGFLVIFFG